MKWEDFKNQKLQTAYKNYVETDIECPECNHKLYVRTDIVLTSYPPQQSYFCEHCGWTGTA